MIVDDEIRDGYTSDWRQATSSYRVAVMGRDPGGTRGILTPLDFAGEEAMHFVTHSHPEFDKKSFIYIST